jgi:Fe-Mn family superoxide dismutase
VWLIVNREKLEIAVTSNADTPLTDGKKSLITLDLWEHTYYLDFQNRRADYVASWLDKLVDWRFAEKIWLRHKNCESARNCDPDDAGS